MDQGRGKHLVSGNRDTMASVWWWVWVWVWAANTEGFQEKELSGVITEEHGPERMSESL